MLSPLYLVPPNAAALTQFNYELASWGSSGAKEGLLIEIILKDQLLGSLLHKKKYRMRRIGDICTQILKYD